MSCRDDLAGQLRERGYRVTPQRAVILEIIAHAGGHSSAQEVYQAAQEQLPGLNIATVYRTLDTLHGEGMLDLLSDNSESVRFSLHDPSNPHDHLICGRCNQVIEIEADLLAGVARALELRTGFHLNTSHLTLSGLCADCRDAHDERFSREGGLP